MALLVVVLVLYVLHQDFWFWRASTPLVLGVLPIGLFYHVAYTVVIAAALLWLVRTRWPEHLETSSGEDD